MFHPGISMEGLKTTVDRYPRPQFCSLAVNPTAYISMTIKLVSLRSQLDFDVCLLIGVDGRLCNVNTRLLAPDFVILVLSLTPKY
jgi:hypothetical protein